MKLLKTNIVMVTFSLILTTCGPNMAPFPDNKDDDTIQKTPYNPPSGDNGESYNLERYAKIVSSSEYLDNGDPSYIVDGWTGTPNSWEGKIWLPKNPSNSSVTMEWNSEVEISEIYVYDNPAKDHRITAGNIAFIGSSSSNTYSIKDFKNLPDEPKIEDGKYELLEHVSIAGPSNPIQKIVISITNSVGKYAGISEVVVMGKRKDTAIENMNLAPFANISAFSSILSTIPDTENAGCFKTVHAKSIDDANKSWISSNNGSTAYIVFDFDIEYSISKIVLHDLETDKGYPNFTQAQLIFNNSTTLLLEKSADSRTATKDLTEPISAKNIRISIIQYRAGKKTHKIVCPGSNAGMLTVDSTGLSGVEIFGSYSN